MPTVEITESLPEAATAVSLTALTRSDTGLTPTGITLPLALTDQGGGTAWGVTFTDPAALPPRYDFTFQVTWPDASTSDVTSSLTPGGAVGVYGDHSDIKSEMGGTNIQLEGDADNDGNAATILASEQKASDWADDQINIELGGFGFVTPATQNLASLRVIYGKLAAYQLHQIRGIVEQKDAYVAKRDEAYAILRRMIAMSIRNPDAVTSFTRVAADVDVAPASIAPTRDRYGYPVRTSASQWPLPPWGYGWGYGGW